MENRKKRKDMADYWSLGASIGICSAVGILLGALLHNLILWLCVGAGVGVVLGAAIQVNRTESNQD